MASRDGARCTSCGAEVGTPLVDPGGVSRCPACGAALTAPVAAASAALAARDTVRLDDPGRMPIGVIQVLASYSSLPIARDLVGQTPCVVREQVPAELAEMLRQRLVAAGARVTVLRGDGSGPAGEVAVAAVPDPIVLSASTWYDGTQVEVHRAGDDAVLARAVVGREPLELVIPTAGSPVAVYLSIRFQDWMPLFIHHNRPLTRSRSLGSAQPKPPQLYGAIARILGTPLEPGKGVLALHATRDEMDEDLAGATFSLSGAPLLRIAYVDDRGGMSPSQDATSGYGFAYVLNVPPGAIQVGAERDGESWAAATVQVAPDAVTEIAFWR